MYQFFDVRFLGGKQERIEDDVQVLMLAQPHNVDQATLYAIDQFVMRGGRVLAFVDPFAEVMAAGGGMNPMANPEGMPLPRSSRCSRPGGSAFRAGR